MLKPLHDYVVLEKVKEEEKTQSGIILTTKEAKDEPRKRVRAGAQAGGAYFPQPAARPRHGRARGADCPLPRHAGCPVQQRSFAL